MEISLHEVAGEWATVPGEWPIYLNRKTGEVFAATDEEQHLLEDEEEDEEGLLTPDWQKEAVEKLQDIQSSEDWVAMPSKFDLDEYRIMRNFCETLDDRIFAADLAGTIGGRGTFGRFKDMVHRHGVHEQWYQFRDKETERFIRDWLEAQEIAYKE